MEPSNYMFTKTAAYPNQRIVKIMNEPVKQPFAQINIDVLNRAAKDLIPVYPAAFELWIYLSKNQTNYEMALSPVLIEQDFGLSRDRYQKGFRVLKERGYLEERAKTLFVFHQVPNEKYELKDKNPVIALKKVR